MRSSRFAALAALMTLAMGSVSAPAWAADGSSICAVHADAVMGTSDSVPGVRFEAFGCDGAPIEFTGSFRIRHVEDPDGHPWTFGVETPSTDVRSTEAGSGIGIIDVGDLPTGPAVIDYRLRASGDSVDYERPSGSYQDEVVLHRGAGWASSAYTEQSFPGSAVSFEYMRTEQQLWGCETVILQDGACVLNDAPSSDQTWQKGYKLTMSWPDPGADVRGEPYTRCRVWSGVWLSHESVDTPLGGTFTSTYSVVLDVPASAGSYTLPLGDQIRFPSSILPGSSKIDVTYSCYSDAVQGRWNSAQMKALDQLVPDLPPTPPATVDATPEAGAVTAEARGSVALGTAQVQGYEMSVVDDAGVVVGSTSVDADVRPMVVMKAKQTHRGSAHAFLGLKPGRYTVRVAAFNAIGASDTVSSRTVVVTAPVAQPVPKLSTPRAVHIKRSRDRYRITWKKPGSLGGGIARYAVTVSRGSHVVQKATVRDTARAFVTKRIVAKGRYRVVVAVVAKDGRTSSVVKTIRR